MRNGMYFWDSRNNMIGVCDIKFVSNTIGSFITNLKRGWIIEAFKTDMHHHGDALDRYDGDTNRGMYNHFIICQYSRTFHVKICRQYWYLFWSLSLEKYERSKLSECLISLQSLSVVGQLPEKKLRSMRNCTHQFHYKTEIRWSHPHIMGWQLPPTSSAYGRGGCHHVRTPLLHPLYICIHSNDQWE
jgi:hypothetical protein